MKFYKNLEVFELLHSQEKRWGRAAEAIRAAQNPQPQLLENVMYSVGDSLTWMRTSDADNEFFVWQQTKRYLTLFYVAEGEINIYTPNQPGLDCLEQAREYSDLDDREFLKLKPGRSGNLANQPSNDFSKTRLKPGQLLIVNVDEPFRLAKTNEGKPFTLVIARVTVEGLSFHNK